MIINNLRAASRLLPSITIRYNYLTPLDKPTYSLAVTSFQQLAAQLMQFPYLQTMGDICPEVSVLGGAFVARIGIEAICAMIRAMKFKGQKQMQYMNYGALLEAKQSDVLAQIQQQRWFMRWTHKIFIIDSVRDYKFYDHTHDRINYDIRHYYRPGVMIASLMNLYLSLNVLRGAHLIVTMPNFQNFCQNTVYLPNLSLHDPTFIMPLLVIPVSYWIIKYSKHPLLINLNHKENLMHSFNIAFMMGLALVPAPGIYTFALLGLKLGHLSCRYVTKNAFEAKIIVNSFFSSVRKRFGN